LTGQTLKTSSPDGLSSVVGSFWTSPNRTGQSLSSRISGILSWRSVIVALVFVETMVNNLVQTPDLTKPQTGSPGGWRISSRKIMPTPASQHPTISNVIRKALADHPSATG
jgi:hypothetical protein